MANYRIRDCDFCGNGFKPTSSTGNCCSWQCKFKDRLRYTKPSENGCINYLGAINSEGYGWFRPSAAEKVIKAHRAAWILEHGEIPEGMHVCHNCDNRKCVNHKHLFLGTNADNVRDKTQKGRASALIGVKHWKARLTDADIVAIRQDGRTQTEIARVYGVRQATISQIIRRIGWKHVP